MVSNQVVTGCSDVLTKIEPAASVDYTRVARLHATICDLVKAKTGPSTRIRDAISELTTVQGQRPLPTLHPPRAALRTRV